MKLTSIQKHILKTAVAHKAKYNVDQPITLIPGPAAGYSRRDRQYYEGMEQLLEEGLIERREQSFAYIADYAAVSKILGA